MIPTLHFQLHTTKNLEHEDAQQVLEYVLSIKHAYITAEVAYILNQKNSISCDAVKKILKNSSIFSTDYSYGMINHKRLISNLKKG